MRRLALGLLTACLTVVVSACSSGGSAFSGNSAPKISQIVLSAQSGGVLRLANQTGAYLAISAQAVSGSNILATQAFDQTFQWTANYVGPTSTYNTSVLGAPVACPAAPTGPYSGLALYVAPPSVINSTNGVPTAVPSSYVPGANVQSNTIYVSPVAGASINGGAPVAAYCLNIVATHTADGVVGSAVVYVSN